MNLYQASFLQAVNKYPNNTALYIEGSSSKESSSTAKTLTYQALFEISQRWGNYITYFNNEQNPVAIYGGRQWQMYGAILATLSTNSAYVPLNTKKTPLKSFLSIFSSLYRLKSRYSPFKNLANILGMDNVKYN